MPLAKTSKFRYWPMNFPQWASLNWLLHVTAHAVLRRNRKGSITSAAFLILGRKYLCRGKRNNCGDVPRADLDGIRATHFERIGILGRIEVQSCPSIGIESLSVQPLVERSLRYDIKILISHNLIFIFKTIIVSKIFKLYRLLSTSVQYFSTTFRYI